MALRPSSKPSAFLAYQFAASDSDDSADEKREELKSKQKAKKKSRSKKKSSEIAVLKDLAMCAVSKPKKSKGKGKAASTAPAALAAPAAVDDDEEDPPQQLKQEADAVAPAQRAELTAKSPPPKTSKAAVKRQPVQRTAPAPPPQQPQQPVKPPAAPTPSTNGVTAQQRPRAVYSPTHVKITRADGQMTRTVAVSEMMDQLYLFGHQNNQLRAVQEQLTVVNRGMQEQLQRDAEIIASLQDEVAMFRQMCLNLQSEVRSLTQRLGSVAAPSAPVHRPPPGM
ncbi:hypothetical protein PybrP1_010145 [[Pythium] brassicae (nom. inval.)]|nr:hypothetical protein PybrP1_010145 [[Pythium] brassicae (nom. inval.)]